MIIIIIIVTELVTCYSNRFKDLYGMPIIHLGNIRLTLIQEILKFWIRPF